MELKDENHENKRQERETLNKKKLKWKSVEIPLDLIQEGLFSLEVLEDETNSYDLRPKTKKRKKNQLNNEEKSDSGKEKEVTIDDEEVTRVTKDWTVLIEGNHTFPLPILRNLYRNKLISPTPIQKITFRPSFIEKDHVLISSETGSGKTLCFVLPIVISLYLKRLKNKIECLVILPTRELAVQVKKIFFLAVEELNIRVLAMIGGISVQKQERLLKRGPSIIVGTPGRISDFIRERKMKEMFQLRFLVLDEVDKFFEDNSYKEVESIVKYVKNTKIQYYLSSATILNMKDKLNNLFRLLSINNPKVCVCTKNVQTVLPYQEITKEIFYKKQENHASLPENLEFKVLECEDRYKEVRLVAYLVENLCKLENKKCIIFVNTVTYVYRLESLLSLMLWKDLHESGIKKKYCATSEVKTKLYYISGIHSRLKQKQRLQRLERYSNNKRAILICTDVASRGLDIPNVDIVIHLQPPKDKLLFLHRSGRTARLKADGVSICVCCPNDKEQWKKLFKEINKNFNNMETIEEVPREQFIKYKELFQLAETIEKNEFQMSKERNINTWMRNTAKKAEIILSEDEEEIEEENKRMRSYKIMKAEKKRLLKIRSELGIDN